MSKWALRRDIEAIEAKLHDIQQRCDAEKKPLSDELKRKQRDLLQLETWWHVGDVVTDGKVTGRVVGIADGLLGAEWVVSIKGQMLLLKLYGYEVRNNWKKVKQPVSGDPR